MVFERENETIGLIVDEIIDIIDDHLALIASGARHVLGSAIVEGVVTDVIDLEGILSLVEIRPPATSSQGANV
jgi:two-component system chemotaxis sensor kinase CheA